MFEVCCGLGTKDGAHVESKEPFFFSFFTLLLHDAFVLLRGGAPDCQVFGAHGGAVPAGGYSISSLVLGFRA